MIDLQWVRALTVPMHIGPLYLTIRYQLSRALSLYRSSKWPPDLKSECRLGPRKEARYTFLFSQKVPASESPPGSPRGPLWREIPAYRAFLHISLSQRPKEKCVPPCSPKAGPLWKQTPIPEPYLEYLSASPVKEPFLQVPLMESPRRGMSRS